MSDIAEQEVLIEDPALASAAPPAVPAPKECLISDEQLTGIYDEILGMLRKEHSSVSEYVENLAELVFNEGDATGPTKEALTAMVRVRTDIPDKMAKIADLMTRLKMKDTSTYKPYMTAHQTNINIGTDRRAEIEAFRKAKKKAT